MNQVPGLCTVATRFGHLYWIPLIPLQTFAIIEGSETGGSFWGDGSLRGVAIEMSGKSVLVAYLRTALVLLGC